MANLIQGDAFHVPLADGSVHCVVTSPPYWGLRKYAGEQTAELLGLEPTPERHIERTVEWAREVWRVLRDDGVLWLNLGDAYSAAGWESNRRNVVGAGSIPSDERKSGKSPGIAAGNLMLMPHRVALALQADGWIIRQDLVWAKPNPMPESVNGWRWQRKRTVKDENRRPVQHPMPGKMSPRAHDGKDFAEPEYEYSDELELRRGSWRHTRAHEYVFMLVKGMQYWSDQEAVREGISSNTVDRWRGHPPRKNTSRQGFAVASVTGESSMGANPSGRNPRSVINIPTSPYKGAHYATFPPSLIAPLIMATCPRWCCPVCGQGWAAVVERMATGETQKMADGWDTGDGAHGTVHRNGREKGESGKDVLVNQVLGHRPTCDHYPSLESIPIPAGIMPDNELPYRLWIVGREWPSVPGIVFDPFVGSGTTVMVAQQLLRQGIGLDISRPYLDEQAILRTGGVPELDLDDLPLFRDNGSG